jgi:long-chain acyl-CoA synthetase
MTFFPETSMAAVFQNRVQKYKDNACVAYKKNGAYTPISWVQMNEMVGALARFLLSKGVQKGDMISIFSANRYEWWVTDLAVLSLNAVDVPIYPTNSAKESRYILDNADVTMCFAGTKDQLMKILEVKPGLPKLREVLVFDDPGEKIPGVITFEEALAAGRALPEDSRMEARIRGITPNDLATIIYTSGTTGDPKGVMLSHQNLLVNMLQSTDIGGKYWNYAFKFLSFLPLSHGYERIAGYYMPINMGRTVYFAESFAKITENFQEVRPDMIISVPRLFEKLHAGILAKVATAPPNKQKIFAWAMEMGRRNLPFICNEKPRTGLFKLQYALADKLVFGPLKKALGMDKLKIAISGGGALSVSDIEFFLGMDIIVLEGFGITECSPCTNCNKPYLIKPGSCGPADLYTEEKIADDGELLIRGPQVMLGYYKNEKATKDVMTDDGFLMTGDIGEFDADGYLRITGRKKEIIITAGGKNIAPLNIESSLMTSPFIEQVAVIGEKRKYLSALIVPAFAELTAWARNNGIGNLDKEALVNDEKVKKLFADEIEKYTKDLGQVEKIKQFTLLPLEWTQESGELTPTLKIKRRIISSKFSGEIELMYPDDGKG